jgi:Uma2 family endonuclease
MLRHAPLPENHHMHMPAKIRRWTVSELERLPDDGNKYELVRGELFVTPAPSYAHETLASILVSILVPYVHAHSLGRVHTPRAVVRARPDTEVEPDLLVRPVAAANMTWDRAPLPLLVAEIVSDTTRRRDYIEKRKLYVDLGIPEYWIVDPEQRVVRVVRPSFDDLVVADMLTWLPQAASQPLVLDVRSVFREALG